ncbi:hypothetical protein A3A60_04705 [Candidatus Curtissbacteria bacterium RIFCSPLOWO2_01_FULL_42_26]|uniref:Uncharacterized protein n=1 Tax=Candidatus Curtissbacteria bacterium RIFCSPLOWO2_01_FULL_42_26 TaxID=1797729 RepID=A0A1F5I1R6_9BACT|nr:MAG: hypothetical protein A3A60_04705 [Candidatus Curtissbacteria bacterium RIFCSPLOWO2_01_FULL_42_26]
MVVEREGNFFESRRAGMPFLKALKGERVWLELAPGTHVDDRTVVEDDDTVSVFKGAWLGTQSSFGQAWYDQISGDAINRNRFGFGMILRWRPGMSMAEEGNLRTRLMELLGQANRLQDLAPHVSGDIRSLREFIAETELIMSEGEELMRKFGRRHLKVVDHGNVEPRTEHF